MQAVILAGGRGTRIEEESHARPKPMIEIGGKPILWHIMKIYGSFGINDFVICCGYKGYMIKEYFANYSLHTSDVTIDIGSNEVHVHARHAEPWKITLVDTGEFTQTGGRLKQIQPYIRGRFCLTYGDGVADINVRDLIAFHESGGLQATITAIRPAGRFGSLRISGARVSAFEEKPAGDGRWISGGFFVLEPEALDRVTGDDTIWEREPLTALAAEGQLAVYKHRGFWSAMDTSRDKSYLSELWASGEAPWQIWA